LRIGSLFHSLMNIAMSIRRVATWGKIIAHVLYNMDHARFIRPRVYHDGKGRQVERRKSQLTFFFARHAQAMGGARGLG